MVRTYLDRLRSSRIAPVVMLLLLLGLYLFFQITREVPAELPEPPDPALQSDWAVYFTEPIRPSSMHFRGGPDERLAAAIDGARYSVDVAAYDLNLWSIRDALLRARRRGVDVRVVVESENSSNRQILDLEQEGIDVRRDGRMPLMHHKFAVIDRFEVWTGSMNFTVNGAYRNDNNLTQVRSHPVAENYTREFDEMFLDRAFGALSKEDTPHPSVEIMGGELENYFSPDDGAAEKIIGAISRAEEEIHFMVFSLTLNEIGDALIAPADQGVEISGVVESDLVHNPGSEVERLVQSGVQIRLDGNPRNMHHKVFIIDDRTVITGSYNFSRSAEVQNDENVLIFHHTEVAEIYLLEFSRVFAAARP
jgi:phosphatidylserine/phosphatidylglycerophosphate/cardiolipin synthase-like enzyme